MSEIKNLDKILTKDFLIEEYVNKKIPYYKIAKNLRCSRNTILKYLKKFDISRETYQSKSLTKNFLIEEFIIKNKSAREIAQEFNFKKITIFRYLKKYNISKNPFSILTKEFLEEEYINKKRSPKEIAKEVQCNTKTIFDYLKKHKLPIRNISEAKKGKKHPTPWMFGNKFRYLDGRSPLIVCIYRSQEYKLWRDRIFHRDNYTCQECNQVGGKLEAHHKVKFKVLFKTFLSINPNLDVKKDKEEILKLVKIYFPFWDINNGITLCYNCHIKVESKLDAKN